MQSEAAMLEGPTPGARRLSVCLINPKFEPSYWGFDFAVPLMPGDKRCWVVTAALPALAALAPANCDVELIDENVRPIDFGDLDRFDVIGVTGMVVQGKRMLEILERLKGARGRVVVGGPYVSVSEAIFADLCDVRFVGEAEETWPAFLNALLAGEPVSERYEQSAKTDMQTVPAPRYDLLDSGRYVMASLQFSRGCPFMCEFCDIITIFGRRPRMKTPEQMIVEFEAIRKAGFSLCFLVDDNFIGNKREAKKFLRALIAWQREHGYPIRISTEASIDLADDAELIDLMVQANFRQVFIGIETPRAESLSEIRKVQNIRGDPMEQKLARIRDGGLLMQAGFIVGFDHDDERVFDEQYRFIQRSGIATALVAMLVPVPGTPLYERMEREQRLDFSDSEVIFLPKLMSRETLKAGYARLMTELYEPEAYFGRLFHGYGSSPAYRERQRRHAAAVAATRSRRSASSVSGGGLSQALRLTWALIRAGHFRRLGPAYMRAWFRLNRPLGREAIPLDAFIGLCVAHWHFYNISRRPQKGAFGTVLPMPAQRVERPAAA